MPKECIKLTLLCYNLILYLSMLLHKCVLYTHISALSATYLCSHPSSSSIYLHSIDPYIVVRQVNIELTSEYRISQRQQKKSLSRCFSHHQVLSN